jgi:NADPH-dependent 2,4-dienoyl-CoA reductase/sulfur reductase-like enzyme
LGKKILIIGGVATGPKAASRARRRDPEAEITIVERKEIFSYAGCGMPFYIEGSIEDVNALLCTPSGVKRDEKYFKNVKDIEVLGNTEALKINRDEKTVTVRDLATGKTRDLPYDKLVLGVGARPFIPRMEGTDLKDVYHLYDTKDAEDIRRALDAGVKRVAIVGGGLIGMEICGAFVSRGCDVSVFEMMDHLVPNLLDKDLALLLEKYLRDKGVKIHTGCRVKDLVDDGSGRVKGVEIADGEMHGSDMVLVAIGVKPNTELAEEAGLELGETHAIAVNEYLQTSDPDIYAGGDCVENTCMITGMKIYTPMGSTANKHGRVIGDNVTGGETLFPGVTRTGMTL